MALKHSRQREALLYLLSSVKCHPSAEWLYTELKKDIPNISLATVYRNLVLLQNEGKIIKISSNSDSDHFDSNTDMHYHFECNSCGSISDIEMPVLSELNAMVSENLNADVHEHSLIFYGICDSCKAKNNN